jgi:hypothetical protein
MSEVPAATAETLYVVRDTDLTPREDVNSRSASPCVEDEVSPAPTVITEQEVGFSTKAAAAARHTRWWTQIFVSSQADSRPTRRYYSPRPTYLEHSPPDGTRNAQTVTAPSSSSVTIGGRYCPATLSRVHNPGDR